MNISKERKIEEAIARMKMLDIIPDAIRQFKNNGTVMSSEPPMGGLYWVNDEQKEMIREFEEKNNALVYLVVRSYTGFGTMDSLLFVSDYEEEWDMDREDIKDDIALTYTINHDTPDFSEFGSIGIKRLFGGLVRVE